MASVNHSVSRQWRSSPQTDFLWFGWDDEFIAFHRPSGKTHYLNNASEQLLTRILLVPMNAAEIAAEYAGAGNFNDQFVDEMMTMLEHFEDLGLVERL